MPRCLNCKTKFTPKTFLQKHCMENDDCVSAFMIWKDEKIKSDRDKKWKEEKKIIKEKLKTLSDYESEAKKSFQKWVRMRDSGKGCISCGNMNPSDWCGSHYFSAGMYSGLMFDERNCHGACNTYCNKYLSGNLLEYRKGLVERYGLEFVDKLESESDAKRNYKYTKQELIAKKLQYDIKIKEFKN